jgi:hypothetical protein
LANGKIGAQLRAAKPRCGVDHHKKKNEPSLPEQTCARQKERAWRRIHEIVFSGVKEKDFIARQHTFAGGVPDFVVKNRVAAEVAKKRKR